MSQSLTLVGEGLLQRYFIEGDGSRRVDETCYSLTDVESLIIGLCNLRKMLVRVV